MTPKTDYAYDQETKYYVKYEVFSFVFDCFFQFETSCMADSGYDAVAQVKVMNPLAENFKVEVY